MGVCQILPFSLALTNRLRWVWVYVATSVWCLNCLLSRWSRNQTGKPKKNFLTLFKCSLLQGRKEKNKKTRNLTALQLAPSMVQVPCVVVRHPVGVALKWFDTAGWPVCMFTDLGGGQHLHSPYGVMFSIKRGRTSHPRCLCTDLAFLFVYSLRDYLEVTIWEKMYCFHDDHCAMNTVLCV